MENTTHTPDRRKNVIRGRSRTHSARTHSLGFATVIHQAPYFRCHLSGRSLIDTIHRETRFDCFGRAFFSRRCNALADISVITRRSAESGGKSRSPSRVATFRSARRFSRSIFFRPENRACLAEELFFRCGGWLRLLSYASRSRGRAFAHGTTRRGL